MSNVEAGPELSGTSEVAKVTKPWHQNRAVIGGCLVAAGLTFMWGLKLLSPVQESPKAEEPPKPPAKTQIKVAEAAPPPIPVSAGPRLTPAALGAPPAEEDLGLKAPVMAKRTQGEPQRLGNGQLQAAKTPQSAVGVGASLIATEVVQVEAVNSGVGTYRLGAGTIIPCILDTAMDTTVAGFIRCHLDRDIYSDTGAIVLLDAGTSVLGEYQASLRQGQERIGVVWSQARTPKGITIRLNSPGTDPVGRAGMDGELDTYFWTRFGAAVMFSLLQDAGAAARNYVSSLATNGTSNQGVNPGQIGINTQGATEQVVSTTVRNSANVPPVLKKNQGERVSIFVRNDLDFSKVYQLQTD
jgi:type IV secretion system protein VirB10